MVCPPPIRWPIIISCSLSLISVIDMYSLMVYRQCAIIGRPILNHLARGRKNLATVVIS